MSPLLLLDVDGVLNALTDDLPSTAVWPRWQRGSAKADGMPWPIVFSVDVVDRLKAWHQQGLVEIQWLTTWGHDANGGLRELLGLPAFAVAGTYDEVPADGAAVATDVASHSAAAPSAPDPLSGHWWKYDVVRRVLREQPDRLVIWVDDELRRDVDGYRRWADAEPRVVPIGPDPRTGLSPSDLTAIARCLRPAAGEQKADLP